jgi:hypothetical protein
MFRLSDRLLELRWKALVSRLPTAAAGGGRARAAATASPTTATLFLGLIAVIAGSPLLLLLRSIETLRASGRLVVRKTPEVARRSGISRTGRESVAMRGGT